MLAKLLEATVLSPVLRLVVEWITSRIDRADEEFKARLRIAEAYARARIRVAEEYSRARIHAVKRAWESAREDVRRERLMSAGKLLHERPVVQRVQSSARFAWAPAFEAEVREDSRSGLLGLTRALEAVPAVAAAEAERAPLEFALRVAVWQAGAVMSQVARVHPLGSSSMLQPVRTRTSEHGVDLPAERLADPRLTSSCGAAEPVVLSQQATEAPDCELRRSESNGTLESRHRLERRLS